VRKILSLFLVTALAVALAGCAAGPHARLDRSQEVFDAFAEGKVLPGYRYYTVGPQNTPNAILGIGTSYTLKGEQWTERDMTPELLKKTVWLMNDLYSGTASGAGLFGSYVVSETGVKVGIWYSAVGTTQVSVGSGGEVSVQPPNPLAINQLQDRLR
jgi:hypothetical protein